MNPLDVQRRGTAVVMRPEGSLTGGDLNEALEDAVEDALEDGAKRVVVDFTGIDQINSVGLATVIRCHAGAHKRGAGLWVCCARERVRAAFEVTRVTALGLMCDTIEEALGGEGG